MFNNKISSIALYLIIEMHWRQNITTIALPVSRSIEDRYLRENVERAGWGREPIRWRWRPNTADRRVSRRRLTSGGRGGAPLIAASWQRRAGWERPAPQPLTHRRRLAIANIQYYLWRSNARLFTVAASDVVVDTRATRLWCFGDFKVGLVSER